MKSQFILFSTSVCMSIKHWWASSSYFTLVICMSIKQWWASASCFTLVICMTFKHWWTVSYCFPQVLVCLLNRDEQVHMILVPVASLSSEGSDELLQTHRLIRPFALPYMNTHRQNACTDAAWTNWNRAPSDSHTCMHQMNRYKEVGI